MIHYSEWDVIIYEESSYHEPCMPCFISQSSFTKIIGTFVSAWTSGFKISMSFTFSMKFNHTQLEVYVNSAPFTVSIVYSCPVKLFLKFFLKQSFFSKLLFIALKLRHLCFCWCHDEFKCLSHARDVAFYSKAISSLTFDTGVWPCCVI